MSKNVPVPKLADYQEQFKDFFVIERKNGILMMRMHTDGGPVKYDHAVHTALAQAWHTIGNDPENEVLILTSTGDYWMGDWNREDMQQDRNQDHYDMLYHDATKLIENFVFDIDFPTIAAVNGPGWHTEFALLADITICTEDAQFQDGHFMLGSVPGDGQGLAFQSLLGSKRAAYYMYTSKPIDAQTSLELGLVSEVLPADKLMDRAWELAEMIMKQPRIVRRMTSQVVRRPWKRLLIDDFQVHIGHEMYASRVANTRGNFGLLRESWTKGKK